MRGFALPGVAVLKLKASSFGSLVIVMIADNGSLISTSLRRSSLQLQVMVG